MNKNYDYEFLYKIFTIEEWDKREKNLSKITGNEFDIKSGYMHLSTEKQLHYVLSKRFSLHDKVILLKLNHSEIKEYIKWEPNSKGELFPHLYNEFIPESSIVNIEDKSIVS